MNDRVLVFYAGMFFGDYPVAELPLTDIPEGCYVRYPNCNWWHRRAGWADAIPEEEVPKELLTLVLLLT
jgi:hypothetical protein